MGHEDLGNALPIGSTPPDYDLLNDAARFIYDGARAAGFADGVEKATGEYARRLADDNLELAEGLIKGAVRHWEEGGEDNAKTALWLCAWVQKILVRTPLLGMSHLPLAIDALRRHPEAPIDGAKMRASWTHISFARSELGR